MSVSNTSLGAIFLKIALALFLIVAGIMTLQLDPGFFGKIQAGLSGNEIASAVHSFFKGDVANVIIIILGICEILAGAFLLIEFFVKVGDISNIVMIIILVFWIIVIVIVDIFGKGGLFNGAFDSFGAFLSFCKILAFHLLVLGAILISRE